MSSEEFDVRYLMLLNNFLVIHRLGLGSFGQALLAKYKEKSSTMLDPDVSKVGTMMEPVCHSASLPHTRPRTNGLVAIKMMKSHLKRQSDYRKITEVNFIQSMPSHINLLQIHHIFIDSLSGKLCIVMEAMNQNLYLLIQKHGNKHMPPDVVKSMLAQLLNGIRHIHSQGYFHMDVKPENILVTPTVQYYGDADNVPIERKKDFYMVKLCDYGLARHFSNKKDLTPYVSTRWYRAPEILLRLRDYTQPIDIWAFACVAVEIVNSRPLFPGANEAEQIWHVLKCLGHPTDVDPDGEAFGGYWEEGRLLAENLGLYMPQTRGLSMQELIPKPEYSLLCSALRPCFLWNPDSRPTVFDLCHHPYFKGTILEEDPLHILLSTTESCKTTGDSPDTIYSTVGTSRSMDMLRDILQQKNTGYDVVSLRNSYFPEDEQHLSMVFGSKNTSFDATNSWVFEPEHDNEDVQNESEMLQVCPFEELSFDTDTSFCHRISC